MNLRKSGCVLILVTVLAACNTESDTSQSRQEQAAIVTTQTVGQQDWTDTLSSLGSAVAKESVAITASVSQTIQSIHFDSGELVKKGQPIVTLTRKQQDASTAAARAALRDAEQQYARNKQLADQQLIARVTLDTQRAAVEAARAQVAALSAQASDHSIVAPFDGVLGTRNISVGTLVSPGTEITTLDDISLIKVDFTIPEAMLSKIKPGQAVIATSDAWPGEEFKGEITASNLRLDQSTRALAARAEIPNAEHKLRPGMLLNVRIVEQVRKTISIPELAIEQRGTQSSVYLVQQDNTVKQTPVKIGARQPGKVEIIEGLKPGDKIVVEGIVKLRNGAKIQELDQQGKRTTTATSKPEKA